MAVLTEDEKLQICEICEFDIVLLNAQLSWLDSYYNETMRTRVRTQFARYTSDVEADFVKVRPNTANYGVELDAADLKRDIKEKLLTLLGGRNPSPIYEDMFSSGGAFQMEVVKG